MWTFIHRLIPRNTQHHKHLYTQWHTLQHIEPHTFTKIPTGTIIHTQNKLTETNTYGDIHATYTSTQTLRLKGRVTTEDKRCDEIMLWDMKSNALDFDSSCSALSAFRECGSLAGRDRRPQYHSLGITGQLGSWVCPILLAFVHHCGIHRVSCILYIHDMLCI